MPTDPTHFFPTIPPESSPATVRSEEVAVRALVDSFVHAVRERDLKALLALYVDDVVAFDPLPPLAHEGRTAVESLWRLTFDGFVSPLACEVHELEVEAAGEIAFCHGLSYLAGTRAGGSRSSAWARLTLGLRKYAGRWLIAHQHLSAPFDPHAITNRPPPPTEPPTR